METFTLELNEKEKMFCGTFKDVSRDLLTRLKEEGYLEKVVVDLFPETFSGEILIDIASPEDLEYRIDFYFDIVATPEMKQPINKYKNRDIDINEDDDDKLDMSITIAKNSSVAQLSDDEKKIMLTL